MVKLNQLWKMGLGVGIVLNLAACTVFPGAYQSKTAGTFSGESVPTPEVLPVTGSLIKKLEEENRQIADELKVKRDLNQTRLSGGAPALYDYRLGPGDVLRINVWNNPDLNLVGVASSTAVNVPPASVAGRDVMANGNLFFPLVGEIKAAGLTLSEFRKALTKELGVYIKDPHIDVGVLLFRSQKVFLSGEVKTPGVYPITDIPMHITDLLGLSGGPTAEANLYEIQLTRQAKVYNLNLYDLYYEGKAGEDILLHHADVVNIPDRLSRKIFIMGEVAQPKSYVMRRGKMSLSEALMDAGGINPFSAAAGRVYVLRAAKDGRPVVYQFNASDPTTAILGDQFVIQARDFVFVNPTDLAVIGRVIGQFFPTISGAAAVKTLSN